MSQVAGAWAWAIVPVLILVPAIAFASLPDQTWIPAIYDGADGDDVVTLVTEAATAQGDITHRPWPPVVSSEGVLMPDTGRCESSSTLRASRGPPPAHPHVYDARYSSLRSSPSRSSLSLKGLRPCTSAVGRRASPWNQPSFRCESSLRTGLEDQIERRLRGAKCPASGYRLACKRASVSDPSREWQRNLVSRYTTRTYVTLGRLR